MTHTLRREEELRRAVVADVAHELRTPVTILRGQTEQLLDRIAEPTVQRLVSLHDEVLRLERLTDDLAALPSSRSRAASCRCWCRAWSAATGRSPGGCRLGTAPLPLR